MTAQSLMAGPRYKNGGLMAWEISGLPAGEGNNALSPPHSERTRQITTHFGEEEKTYLV